jgi:hypothetical protein
VGAFVNGEESNEQEEGQEPAFHRVDFRMRERR